MDDQPVTNMPNPGMLYADSHERCQRLKKYIYHDINEIKLGLHKEVNFLRNLGQSYILNIKDTAVANMRLLENRLVGELFSLTSYSMLEVEAIKTSAESYVDNAAPYMRANLRSGVKQYVLDMVNRFICMSKQQEESLRTSVQQVSSAIILAINDLKQEYDFLILSTETKRLMTEVNMLQISIYPVLEDLEISWTDSADPTMNQKAEDVLKNYYEAKLSKMKMLGHVLEDLEKTLYFKLCNVGFQYIKDFNIQKQLGLSAINQIRNKYLMEIKNFHRDIADYLHPFENPDGFLFSSPLPDTTKK